MAPIAGTNRTRRSHGGRPARVPLTSLFSSSTLPAIVALLDRLGPLAVDELAERAQVSRVSINTEVRRLVALGLVDVSKQGSRRLITLADTPAASAVRDLAVLACGVPAVVADEFGDIDGAAHVFIYGSWAARDSGEPGRLPQDVDVLVVGSADRDDVFEAAERATSRIGIPVSARRVSLQAWNEADEPFVRTIRARPMREVTT